jgi:hypothetical protein
MRHRDKFWFVVLTLLTLTVVGLGGAPAGAQQTPNIASTAIEFPPMQKGARFNLDAVKAKIEAARAAMSK